MATLPDRTCTLTLLQEGTGKTAQVHISQEVKPFVPEYVLEVKTKAYDVPAEGGDVTINFTSYRTTKDGGIEPVTPSVFFQDRFRGWVDKPTISDITVGTDGKGSAKASIYGMPASYDPREFVISIRQNRGESFKILDVSVTVAAKADDGVFTAEPTTLSYQAAGGTVTSAVTSTSKGKTVGWSVSNKADLPDWVTISGEGTDTLSVTTKSSE